MDQRLMKLLQTAVFKDESCMLDTYNQSVQYDCSCTIRTNINTANHHFILEDMSEIKYIGQMSSSQNSRVIDPSGISYAMTNGEKDGTPKIVEPLRIPQATEQGYVEVPQGAVFDGSYPNSKTRRGRLQEGGKVTPTLTSQGEPPLFYEGVEYKGRILKEGDGLYSNASKEFFQGELEGLSRTKAGNSDASVVQNYRIRKLTERECFRLMGVSESDIDKIQASGVSRSQQYRMAGNSIVVDVLEHIFRKLFIDTGQESQQLSLF